MLVQKTIKNLKTNKIVYIEFIELEDVFYEYNYINKKKVDLFEFTDYGFYYIIDGIERSYKFYSISYETVNKIMEDVNM